MFDLQVINVRLRNLDGPLPIQAVRFRPLRGVFYTALGGEDSPQARSIHVAGGGPGRYPAPYTIGLIPEDENLVGLRITTMQDLASPTNIGNLVMNVWNDRKNGRDPNGKVLDDATIRVGSAHMQILTVDFDSQYNKTFDQIWEEAKPEYSVKLLFETPARFPFYRHIGVLPIPQAVWQYYEQRWRTFSKKTLPPEFQTWVLNQVHATDANIKTSPVPIEGTKKILGITGYVTYKAFKENEDECSDDHENMVPESQLPNYLQAFQALAMLSEYCGTGDNAQIGMGRTKYLHDRNDGQDVVF